MKTAVKNNLRSNTPQRTVVRRSGKSQGYFLGLRIVVSRVGEAKLRGFQRGIETIERRDHFADTGEMVLYVIPRSESPNEDAGIR